MTSDGKPGARSTESPFRAHQSHCFGQGNKSDTRAYDSVGSHLRHFLALPAAPILPQSKRSL